MNSDITKVWKLIEASDAFLRRSKACVSSSDQYNTFVKCSLDCLFNIIKLYGHSLNGHIESTILFKIANTIYQESVSYDLAREYCVKGIQVCKRHGPELINMKFQLQYLNIQIQMKTSQNEQEVVSYLDEVIDEIPELPEFIPIRIFFKFIRTSKFGTNGNLQSKIDTMNNLLSQYEPLLDDENYKLYQIIVFNSIQLKLISKAPSEEITAAVNKLNTMEFKQLVQFKGIILLIRLNIALQANDYLVIRPLLKELNVFLKSTSGGWNDAIAIKLADGFLIDYQWITYREYSIESFLVLGVSNMVKDDNSSIKVFNKCKELIYASLETNKTSNQLTLNGFSFKQLKLKFQLCLLDAYLLLLDMMNNHYPQIKQNGEIDFSKFQELNQMIEKLESGLLGRFEQVAFDHFNYLILFLKGVIYQSHQEFDKAIANYRKILMPVSVKSSGFKTRNIEDIIGLTNYLTNNDAQILSITLINVLPIIEKRVESFKKEQRNLDEFDDGYSESMKNFESNLMVKQVVLDKLEKLRQTSEGQAWITYLTVLNLLVAVKHTNEDETSEIIGLFKSLVEEKHEQQLNIETPTSSSPEPGHQDQNASRLLSFTPGLKSMIYFTIGENDQSKRYSIQDSTNERLSRYMKSKELSSGRRGSQKLSALASRRISTIKAKNPKLFKI